ncbi:MAG: ribose-phosphate pyrophosphokinase [Chloroflexi bacterium]|nr:ribose-phosphate pyrophosphokinase [Chloroflexota bacterium]
MKINREAVAVALPGTSGAHIHAVIPARRVKLFAGTAHLALAQEIADYLDTTIGELKITTFSDNEVYVRIQESVRGDDIYIVQPTCDPVNHHLMELLIITDAFKRASVRQICAVIPYFGYARQDRKAHGREAITAKLVANLLTTAGTDRVLTVDLHAGQIQGFFDIPVDNMFASPVLLEYLRQKELQDVVIVSPDIGGVARARAYANRLDVPLAIVDKRRPAHNVAEVLHIIGDVAGKTAVIVDDMVDTAGTMCEGARFLITQGAKAVYAFASHGVLSGPAIQRLQDSPIQELVVTNTIPLAAEKRSAKIKTLSIAPLLGEAINRIHQDASVSTLFD